MTINEVSKKFNITADTLRYYEKIGLLPKVARKNKIRDYSDDDCNWISFIKCMRSAGIPIEALKEYVGLFKDGEKTIKRRKEILIEQRDILNEKLKTVKETIDRLDVKIKNYEQLMLPIEKDLK